MPSSGTELLKNTHTRSNVKFYFILNRDPCDLFWTFVILDLKTLHSIARLRWLVCSNIHVSEHGGRRREICCQRQVLLLGNNQGSAGFSITSPPPPHWGRKSVYVFTIATIVRGRESVCSQGGVGTKSKIQKNNRPQ